MKTTIMDASGKDMVILGGPHMYKRFVHGDVTTELTWINEEPHMLLYRSNPGAKQGAFQIDINDAHRYANSRTGGPSPSLRMDCIEAAAAIGFAKHDVHGLFKVMTCILDHIDDLVKMPPEPTSSQLAHRPAQEGDELSIKVDGKTVAEISL